MKSLKIMSKVKVLIVSIDSSNELYLDTRAVRDSDFLMNSLVEFAGPVGSAKGHMEFRLEEMEQKEFDKLEAWEP